jgi:methylmalonyl-CoA mutase N-terminal domain/subunit
MIAAVKNGFIQSEIEKSSLERQRAIDRKEKMVVGLNAYAIPEEDDIRPVTTRPNPQEVDRHIKRIKQLKANRNQAEAQKAMDELKRAAEDENRNIFEAVVQSIGANLTHGEIISTLREIYGVGVPLISIG